MGTLLRFFRDLARNSSCLGLCFVLGGSGGCVRAHPPGVAPEALEEWVYSSRGFFLRLSKEFYRVCRAHEREFGSLGLGVVAGRTLEPLHGARGRSVVSLSLLVALAHPFCSEGGVEHAKLPSVGTSSDISGELLSGQSKWRPVPHSIGVG